MPSSQIKIFELSTESFFLKRNTSAVENIIGNHLFCKILCFIQTGIISSSYKLTKTPSDYKQILRTRV